MITNKNQLKVAPDTESGIRIMELINGYECVDLGLSVKWAICNMGAVSLSDIGAFFAWGETEPKNEFTWENYKFRLSGLKYEDVSFNKYNTMKVQESGGWVQKAEFWQSRMESFIADRGVVDNKTRLDMCDDVAHSQWGATWRMPTKEELDELVTKCTWKFKVIEERNGYVVTSRINGNYIFIPEGEYWSSSLRENMPAEAFGIFAQYIHMWEQDEICWISNNRCNGLLIRPVSE